MSQLSDKTLSHLQALVELPDLTGTRYRILAKIGEGGMGAVFRAQDATLNREVALKVMDGTVSEPQFAERMLQEAQVIARLEHPGIVPIHDAGVLPDGRVYYAMKLVHGDRLDQFRQKKQSLPELLRVFQKVCDAVAFAHAQKIIHRDLKPANIMVAAFGEVLVMDWGLAKILEDDRVGEDGEASENGTKHETQPTPEALPQHITRHGTVMGTPDYMAPEQAKGENRSLNARTDVYALGAILYFLLTGAHPGSEESAAVPRTKAPKQLLAICQRAMANDRQQRYPNASELARDVERYLNDQAVSAHRDNPFEKIWRWLMRYKFLIFIVLIYMLVRIALFYLMR